MAELVCQGMVGLGSIWVGPDELWLNWFARVWWIVGRSGWGRMGFGWIGLQGYGGVWVDLGGRRWALAELVCEGMVEFGSIWVGVDGHWLCWFARVWWIVGRSGRVSRGIS